jgi:hypothetical protein
MTIPATPPAPSAESVPSRPASPRGRAGRLFVWIFEGKKGKAVAVLTFLLGAIGGKTFDSAWERIFPPEDLTDDILAVSRQGVSKVEEAREAILAEVRALPGKLAMSANPEAEVQRVGTLVNDMAQYANGLGQLNNTAVQIARGEEVAAVPRFASISSVTSSDDAVQVQEAPAPEPFVTNGVGGGRVITAADRAAQMKPTLWARMGETRRVGDNPAAYLRVIGWDGSAVTVAVNGQAWRMTPASFIHIDHNQERCRLSYATTRAPEIDTDTGDFHGFVLECNTGDPTQPPLTSD